MLSTGSTGVAGIRRTAGPAGATEAALSPGPGLVEVTSAAGLGGGGGDDSHQSPRSDWDWDTLCLLG